MPYNTVGAFRREKACSNLEWLNNGQRVILIATYPGAGSDQAKINIKFSRFGDGAGQRRTDSQAV
jgi:hypothetical protein